MSKYIQTMREDETPICIRTDSVAYWEPCYSEKGEPTKLTLIRFAACPIGVVIDEPYHEFTHKMMGDN